jgi:hypothetical protein
LKSLKSDYIIYLRKDKYGFPSAMQYFFKDRIGTTSPLGNSLTTFQ